MARPVQSAGVVLMVGAEMILAALFILPGIGNNSFWLDETFSAHYAFNVRWFWTERVGVETNMWLYFALLQAWALLGHSEAWLRGLSALFALACIPMAVRVGTQMFSARAGLLAGFFLALNPFFIHYGREARSYSLLMLLSLCATDALVQLVRAPTLRRGWAYGLAVLLCIYAHFYGALHALAHGVSMLVLPFRRWPWRPLLIAAAPLATGLSAMLLFLGPRHPGMMSWLTAPTWTEMLATCRALTGRGDGPTLFYALCLLAAVGFAIGARAERWIWTLMVSSIVVPVALAYLGSVCVFPLFQARYLSTTVPALALGAGAVLSRCRPAAASWAIALLVGWGSLAPVRRDLAAPPWEAWRELTDYVRAAGHPDDVLICHVRYMMFPVRVYGEMGGDLPVTLFDLETRMPEYAGPQTAPPPEVFDDLARHHNRLWLVLGHNHFSHLRSQEQTAKLAEALRAHYMKVEARPFGAITLELWTRRATHEGLEPVHRAVQ